MTNSHVAAATALTGRKVLAALIGFFAVVFAVNGIFLALALSTNTGVVSNEPYRKGLKYNEQIAADTRQSELGWTSEITLNTRDGKVVALIKDRDGAVLAGLRAIATIGLAATDREDVAATLTETAPGHYEASFPNLKAGGYIANLEVSNPGDGSRSEERRVGKECA